MKDRGNAGQDQYDTRDTRSLVGEALMNGRSLRYNWKN